MTKKTAINALLTQENDLNSSTLISFFYHTGKKK